MYTPAHKVNRIGWPDLLKSSDVNEKKAHILANHCRYERKAAKQLFPNPKSLFITILRHPIKQFESLFIHYDFYKFMDHSTQRKKVNMSKAIDKFRRLHIDPVVLKKYAKKNNDFYLAQNPNAFDLGLNLDEQEISSNVDALIDIVDGDFDIVMILEYFDESLVLLMRRACWNIDDIVYYKLNARLETDKILPLDASTKASILRKNHVDYKIYQYFAKRLMRQIGEEGKDFFTDLDEFRDRLTFLRKSCIAGNTEEKVYGNKKKQSFTIKKSASKELKSLCTLMLRNELQYLDFFQDRQFNENKEEDEDDGDQQVDVEEDEGDINQDEG